MTPCSRTAPRIVWRDQARILRAMRSAARAGFDPYNSHDVQSARWMRAWQDAQRRAQT